MFCIDHRIVVIAVGFLLATVVESSGQGTCLTVPGDPDVKYDSLDIGLLGLVSLQDFGEVRASDVWGYLSPSGREYALIGLHESFGIVEVTDPANPVIVDQIPGPATCWRDIKVFDQFAFGVSDSVGNGLLIIDLSDLDNGVVTLAAENDLGVGFRTAHNIALNPDSGFAYLCIDDIVGGGKFTAVDVSDPLNPKIAGMWEEEDRFVRVHDAQVVNYIQGPFAGREIAFCFCEDDGVRIMDVTDKANMFVISAPEYPDTSYCHQGWLSEDRRFLFVDDELDERDDSDVSTTTTYVFDVQDVDNAAFISSFTTGLPSSDHNLMVRGQLLYEADYSTGLRVFDVSDINSIVETAFFDTYPENDDVGAGSLGTGAWGVYTALPSQVILVSDRNRGLFILTDTECGNGVLEAGELCDTAIPVGQPGACPTSCDDADPCTTDTLLDAGTCKTACAFSAIRLPADGDGCCPPGANANLDNDCVASCGNFACETGEDEVLCPADCSCIQDSQCDDGFACTVGTCTGGVCFSDLFLYGDVDHDGDVDLFDLFCILNGFGGDFSMCSFEDDDLEPCEGDADIDLFDLFAVLNAFAGIDPCCGG